ncbi:hypothetical protein K0F54_19945, partial [Bacteroides fragilis]|nr:hypothetical protein [Bacteroides fragilis]
FRIGCLAPFDLCNIFENIRLWIVNNISVFSRKSFDSGVLPGAMKSRFWYIFGLFLHFIHRINQI